MPKLADWFPAPSATTPFEAGVRQNEGKRVSGTPLDAVINVAPGDVLLLTTSAVGSAKDPVAGHAERLLEKRYDYDLLAIDAALKPLTKTADWPERTALLQKACAISPRDCADLGLALRWLRRDEEAAAAYERGFADPSIDSLSIAADAGWMVNYYYRNKQTDEALALADRAASNGSWNGKTLRGRLLERLGRLDEAELDIASVATRYESYEQLLGFYYRRVEVDRNAAYEPRWQRWLAEVFPDGLQPESSAMTTTPKSGVFVYKDSEVSREAGIRAGDIIVGLEGWRVDTFEQYRAINAMKDDDPGVQLTLWRGALIKIDTQMPGRLFGTDIRTHPMKGWIQ
jgi:tetratricopeptide (TPR) repeat protein